MATTGSSAILRGTGDEFSHYSNELWGITASESPKGYVIWGGPPRRGPIDGSSSRALRAARYRFCRKTPRGLARDAWETLWPKVWGRFGFADAFNPATGWAARDYVGINTGITLLMAENARTGLVWDLFMKIPKPAPCDATGRLS